MFWQVGWLITMSCPAGERRSYAPRTSQRKIFVGQRASLSCGPSSAKRFGYSVAGRPLAAEARSQPHLKRQYWYRRKKFNEPSSASGPPAPDLAVDRVIVLKYWNTSR